MSPGEELLLEFKTYFKNKIKLKKKKKRKKKKLTLEIIMTGKVSGGRDRK